MRRPVLRDRRHRSIATSYPCCFTLREAELVEAVLMNAEESAGHKEEWHEQNRGVLAKIRKAVDAARKD